MTSNDTPAVFEVAGLSRIYTMGEVQVRALDNIDLTVQQRDFVVILGPSGSWATP
jgi:putative ABC transport system ATP-binding protein